MWLSIRFCISYVFLASTALCQIDRERSYPERPLLLADLAVDPINYPDYILPTDLKPTDYTLTLTPDLNAGTFTGEVVITMQVVTTTNRIVINMNNNTITITDLGVTAAGAAVTSTYTVDGDHQMLVINLTSFLEVANPAILTIKYNGLLRNDMLGFYKSTYKTATATHSLAITQFESTFARSAFPCFDEPQYRAVFNIKIYRTADLTSMSNMVYQTTGPDPTTNLYLDTYGATRKMPTYLVAFGVSDFVSSSMPSVDTFRVFSRDAVKQDTAYLVSVGQNILNTIGSFVGIPYPLPKMDVVAVPDFNAGAMENWGLTTYRENYVLYDPTKNTWWDKFGVLSVVTHEFGHQWFGDLVTPQWWDYTWLNEAFATYFEYTASDLMEPTWGMGSTMFVTQAVQYALGVDVGNPKTMTRQVYIPQQIENIFDYVIYEKGGSVLRMTENFLTTPVWKSALNQYLTANSYGTGVPESLFEAFQAAATIAGSALTNINETMQGWTTQPGYPLITVTATNTANMYNVTQAPYNLDAGWNNLVWNVPLTFTSQADSGSQVFQQWLLPSTPDTSMVTLNSSSWVLFNIDQIGYYRVNYDAANWAKLKAQLDLKHDDIRTLNRAQLLDDAFHLAQSGHLDYQTAIGLTMYLPAEGNFAPWRAFFSNMKILINRFAGTTTGDGLLKYSQDIMRAPFSALTANLTELLSTFEGSITVQSAALFTCDVMLSTCETLALQLFENWRQNTSVALIPEIKQTILCTGLRLDTTGASFMDVWNYYLSSNNGGEKRTLLNAMGCVTNEAAANTYLGATCDVAANNVRLQDRWIAFGSLVTRQSGLGFGLKYIANNFASVSNALGSDLGRVIGYIANTISQQAHVDQVNSIINDANTDPFLRDLLNSTVIPAVTRHQQWTSSAQAGQLKSWVDSYVRSSAPPTVINILLMLLATFFIVLN